MKSYIVKQGDTLWKIARDHGFLDEKSLSGLAENADLFTNGKRNDFRINPKDEIFIPELSPACHNVDVNGKRVFKTPSRKGYLRLKVLDDNNATPSYFKYEIIMGDITESGDQSTHAGDIEFELPTRLEFNKVILPGNDSSTQPLYNLSSDDKLKQTAAQLKLFLNADLPDEYIEYTVHFNFSSKDGVVGLLQQLSNQRAYSGCVPGQNYEQKVGSVNKKNYPDKDESQIIFDGEITNNKNSLPLPAAENFQPQYYSVAWEVLRYERIFELVNLQHKDLKQKLEQAKKSSDAFDVLNTQTIQAQMDKDYYQYNFNYWMDELSKLWQAHQQNDLSYDNLLRVRQHDRVDQKLKEFMPQWRQDFNSKNDKDELLAMPFPQQVMPAMAYDIYTSPYSTQHAKDKLSTHIVSPPMTSRVRFCYDDQSDQPIANSYVLYWRYDKSDNNKIETGREDYYRKASIMMPIGIGKTDAKGYLVQSVPFDDQYLEIENNQFTMQGGDEPVDPKKFISSIKAPSDWNAVFKKVNSQLPKFNEDAYDTFSWLKVSLGLKFSHLDHEESNTNEALKESLVELKENFPDYYKHLRVSTSNHLFNYYSSGNQDTWGFMVYPPDGGLFQTQDLAKLGNEGKYAYKGAINAPVSLGKQTTAIKLPCTLQEWERRLKVQNHALKSALESFQTHTSSHQNNINSLGRMNGLLDIYKRYPYEHQEASTASKSNFTELSGEVKKLTEAIQGIIEDPHSEKDKGIHTALKNMKDAKEAIMELLKADGFREQLALYQNAFIKDEKNVSPYMTLDESWQSVYGTIADALTFLSAGPEANEVFDDLINPVLESLLSSNMVSELILNGHPAMIDEMEEAGGDQIPINQQGHVITETHEALGEVVEKVYARKENNEVEPSLLNEIFNSDIYKGAQWGKDTLNQWVNKTPGAPSVFMVILENYSSFVMRQAMRNGATKGFHIRLMMLTSQVFSFLGDGQVKESSILSLLRSNRQVRNAAKIAILEGSRNVGSVAVSKRQGTMDDLQKRIDVAKKSEQINLNSTMKRLKKQLAAEEATVQNLSDTIDYKINKQIALEKGEIKDVINGRPKKNSEYADEFYKQADGRNARIYKSVLTAINIVCLVEDFVKISRFNQDPSAPKIDADIVFAHYAKTVTDSAVACAGTLLLINRWIGSNRLLKDGGDFFGESAGHLAVGASIIGLYISSRELYEDYNNKTLLEKTDLYLGLTADALTTIGYLLTKVTEKVATRLLGVYAAFLIPGLGQVLMIIGAVVMLVQLGLSLYVGWQAREFRRKGAVGYYFWKEFESIKELSQRYYHEEYYVSPTKAETESYNVLLKMYGGYGLLGNSSDAEGWGHLSWRGAVPFFVSWRRAGISEGQLLDMIEDLAKVPDISVSESTKKNNQITTVDTTKKLLSPEVMVKFYLHLEEIKKKKPNEKFLFTSGNTNLTYQAVINQLEQGIYIPAGETDEAIEHLKDIDDELTKVGGLSVSIKRTKHVVWDNEHFRHPLPASE